MGRITFFSAVLLVMTVPALAEELPDEYKGAKGRVPDVGYKVVESISTDPVELKDVWGRTSYVVFGEKCLIQTGGIITPVMELPGSSLLVVSYTNPSGARLTERWNSGWKYCPDGVLFSLSAFNFRANYVREWGRFEEMKRLLEEDPGRPSS